MSRVACDYLAILGSKVDVERLFNSRRDVLGIRRFLMLSKTLGMLIKLKDNIRRKEESR